MTGAAFIVRETLVTPDFLTGWILLAIIVFLAAYNVRKSLPFLPLGTSALWLQIHIYAGLLSFVLFLMHVDYSLPHGLFESLLATIYLLVFGSGVIGLYITRSYPKRLTHLGEEVIFEQIPVIRKKIQTDLDQTILESAEKIPGSELPIFYRDELYPFMMQKPDFVSHLVYGNSRHWRHLLRKLSDVKRFFNEEELNTLAIIEAQLHRKHQLDTQHVLQSALKFWLFVHIPATYSLLTFIVLHVVLVQVWSGGAL